MNPAQPVELYVPALDRTITLHWANHALAMSLIWFVMVPTALIAIRFFKPHPTPWGIPRGTGRFDRRLLWWTIHWTVLYAAMGLSIGSAGLAIYLTGRVGGSVHGWFGLATVGLGALQIVSAWFRGTHGGRHGAHSDPSNPDTWHGDHYDLTPRRRWFEAYHRTAGYFTVACALGAVASGLTCYWLPAVAAIVACQGVLVLVFFIVCEGRGLRHDTYRSVYGNLPQHPGNKKREGL